jgi:ferredoxin
MLARLQEAANARHLTILGGFHPGADDNTPADCQTLLLLGPDEPAFWPAFTQSPEWQDGAPDPMDRWSARIIGGWAADLGARALFPFGGPPFAPFYAWALRSGRMHSSPVQFLVHDSAGLFVSFRGALALRERVDLPPAPPNPCDSCRTQPCRTACPSGALTAESYDVPRCRSYLASPAGAENLSGGCLVRRSCPVSQNFGRIPAQSAYHMQQFKEG